MTKNYRDEVELVAALNKGGKNIPVEKVLDYVYGYALGLEMTRRDLQRFMGDQKKPWEIGKSFDSSTPIDPIFPVSQIGHFTKGTISLSVKLKGVIPATTPNGWRITQLSRSVETRSRVVTF